MHSLSIVYLPESSSSLMNCSLRACDCVTSSSEALISSSCLLLTLNAHFALVLSGIVKSHKMMMCAVSAAFKKTLVFFVVMNAIACVQFLRGSLGARVVTNYFDMP